MLGYMAIGLAVVVSVVPASFAQDPRVLEHCESAGTGIGADERQAEERASNTGVFLEAPIGRVCVGPEFLDGEPIYVRRTPVSQGMTVVEVSTTPFLPVLGSNDVDGSIGRPDQPAGW